MQNLGPLDGRPACADAAPKSIHAFRTAVEAHDLYALGRSLAPDVVFYPPIVDNPFRGRERTVAALTFAATAFGFTDEFRYTSELRGGKAVALFFETRIDGSFLEGVDHLLLDDDELVRELRITMRPISSMQKYVGFVREAIASGQLTNP